jgi:rod shape-determining protein MreD
VRTAIVILAVGGALVVQTTLSGLAIGGAIAVNLVLVAVVYLALAYGPMTGMLAGMLGGLAQDALAGGIVGIGGLTKTAIGFVVGVLSAQFNLSPMLPRLVMFVAATFVHDLVFHGLHAMIGTRPYPWHPSAILAQSLVNAAVGLAAFLIVEQGPEVQRRRRLRQSTFGKKRF